MDEELVNQLSQMADEIAGQVFETDEVRANAPEIQADMPVDGTNTLDNADEEEDRDFIVPNISTSVVEEATARFSSAEWFEKMRNQSIILAGLGGIGSWCSLLLGRCHPKEVYLFDNDTIEAVNMAGQLYKRDNVGDKKAYVSASTIVEYCGYATIFQRGRYDENEHPTTDIMICGFDNMEARRYFYSKWKEHVQYTFTPENCLFIDGRLNAEEWQVFAIRGTDSYRMNEYERNWLFEDNDVEEAPCSYKQTSFCASMIASYMVNIFVNFIANLCNPIIDRDIPFLTEYDAKTMYLKTVQ